MELSQGLSLSLLILSALGAVVSKKEVHGIKAPAAEPKPGAEFFDPDYPGYDQVPEYVPDSLIPDLYTEPKPVGWIGGIPIYPGMIIPGSNPDYSDPGLSDYPAKPIFDPAPEYNAVNKPNAVPVYNPVPEYNPENNKPAPDSPELLHIG